MDEKHERRLRRSAVSLRGLGWPLRAIGARLRRSPEWVAKWVRRFERQGSAGLSSRSRRPRHRPTATPAWVRQQVLRLRRRLERAPVGLIGAPPLQRAWRQERLPGAGPSRATIKRILQRAGRTRAAAHAGLSVARAGLDRTLPGGQRGQANDQRRQGQPGRAPARARGLGRAGDPGLCAAQPRCRLQRRLPGPARDGAIRAPGPVRRRRTDRLARGEAERNGAIERFNRLWNTAFYNRRRFRSPAHVQAASPAFEAWYMHD